MTDKIKTITFGPFSVLVNKQGYVNGSDICTKFKKRMGDWRTQASVKSLINTLANKLNANPSDLIIKILNVPNSHRGTYIHPNLIISLLRWCSCDYDVALNETILELYHKKNSIDTHIIKTNDSGKVDSKSGIYLIELGSVEDVGYVFDIEGLYPDYYTVYKYGMSVDIEKRLSTHKRNYIKDDGFNLKLIYSQYIDCRFRSKSERDLQNLFIDLNVKISNEKYREIIVISKNMLRVIKAMYDSVAFKYQI